MKRKVLALLLSTCLVPAVANASERAEVAIQAFDDFCVMPQWNATAMEKAVLAQGGTAIAPERSHARDLERPGFHRTESHAWQVQQPGLTFTLFQSRYEADTLNQTPSGPLDDCQIMPFGVAAAELNVALQQRYGEKMVADTLESDMGGMIYNLTLPQLIDARLHVRSDGENGTIELFRDEDW